ncbi:MAG: DUF6291 domain-containing protein [Bacteroides sp.]|uniref:DUF6291 domain-containing protein n=2 Tax=Bacteroides sp. TaxID=29523 RepID=UPI002FCBD56C
MRDNRDTFVFYRSFKECMSDLSDTDKLIMYEAISDYSLDLKEPHLVGFPKALFSLIRPILDANIKRWKNGSKGGAPKGNSNNKGKNKLTESQPKVNQDTTESQANKDKDKDDNISTKVDEESRKKDSPKVSLSDRNQKFKDELTSFVEQYGKEMIRAFFDYWSEPNKTNTKMRFELEKTWNLSGRLRTWERRSNEKR